MEYGRIIPERKKGCRNETGNGKKVGIWICLSPNNYYLNPTYLLSILLLLSESYGSAFKSILAFNYEKIALVGSGRRSEDRKSRKKVLYYLSVLWLFHFTNRSPPVYYVMVSRKNQNHRRDVSWGSAPCKVSKFILSKSRSGVGSKKNWKNSGKKTGARGQYYTFHVWNEIDWSEMSEIRKEKSERNEFIITILVVNWVWFMERRLVAEEGSLSKKTWLQKINRSWWAPELGPVVDNGYRRKSLLECQETFQMV